MQYSIGEKEKYIVRRMKKRKINAVDSLLKNLLTYS